MYLFEYQELIKNLVISDLKIKYSNSVLGFAWSILNPLLMMLVLFFVFGNVFQNQDNFIGYLLTGLLAWRFFSMGTTFAMNSIVSKSNLVTKIYIRREILTISVVISSLISSLIEFLVLIPLLIILGMGLSGTFLLFPFIHLIFFIIIYGTGLILASLFVYYRDMNQIWELILQVGFFLSPIFYPISYIPNKYLFYYNLNPITLLIKMYRAIILDGALPKMSDMIYVFMIGLVVLFMGTILFKKLSKRFAEVI
ncbi:MAG: ABC transporter permease [ANME-2 cluster archaeon]|nr:ABC transporter permease [ANME-2 cluster archaeon]